jgi:hypothetical protein
LPVQPPQVTPISGVGAVHDHVFGHCSGQLVVGERGIRYETAHKDAFAVSYGDLERFEVDAAKRRLRITPRGGRTYHFTDPTRTSSGMLAAFHAEVQHHRTRSSAQDE